jgi:hypothetical protein
MTGFAAQPDATDGFPGLHFQPQPIENESRPDRRIEHVEDGSDAGRPGVHK